MTRQFKKPRKPDPVAPINITRYDASYRKLVEHSGEFVFVKIGAAFPRAGGRICVLLDALPLQTWDGQLWLFPKSTGPAGSELVVEPVEPYGPVASDKE